MVLIHTSHSIIIGIIVVIISYMVYRKVGVSVWGWVASFIPDSPVFILVPFGATNLGGVMWLTHTIGIFIFPIILVIIDILLIEVGLLRYLKPIGWLGPKSLKTALKIEHLIERLQKYNAIPRPVRVKRVYLVGVLAGIVSLVLNLVVGML